MTRYGKLRETLANPFRRKRRANQSARYLNRRQEQEHREKYTRAGNLREIHIDTTHSEP